MRYEYAIFADESHPFIFSKGRTDPEEAICLFCGHNTNEDSIRVIPASFIVGHKLNIFIYGNNDSIPKEAFIRKFCVKCFKELQKDQNAFKFKVNMGLL